MPRGRAASLKATSDCWARNAALRSSTGCLGGQGRYHCPLQSCTEDNCSCVPLFSCPMQLCARRGSALSPRLETPPQPRARIQCPALSPAFRNGDQNLQGFHSVLLVLSVLVIVALTAWLATLLFFHGTACSDSGPKWCPKPARGQG